ncbi:hypothetical protein ABWW58_13435 [Sporolactobacillus sp. STCC-11]|uniref:hypothetical protein n=1 Tax=Sporolactobacillus caesalpiniae TaxID=3230362 RepID=UPI003398B246
MNRSLREFIALGSIMTGIFLLTVNLFTGVSSFWAIYPVALLLCPLVWVLTNDKKKGSIVTSSLFVAFCIIQNLLETPHYFWVVYLLPLAVAWPTIVCAGMAALRRSFSYYVSVSVIMYYVMLNIFFEPRFPWCIFPIFALVWWPLSISLASRPRMLGVLGAGWTIIFFAVLNMITTPDLLWAIHPIFVTIWWPLSVYLAKKPFRFAVVGAVLTITYFSIINYMLTPDQLWAVYPAFAIVWWPLSVYYFVKRPVEA